MACPEPGGCPGDVGYIEKNSVSIKVLSSGRYLAPGLLATTNQGCSRNIVVRIVGLAHPSREGLLLRFLQDEVVRL